MQVSYLVLRSILDVADVNVCRHVLRIDFVSSSWAWRNRESWDAIAQIRDDMWGLGTDSTIVNKKNVSNMAKMGLPNLENTLVNIV
jgi:hypothetical protein